MALNRFDNPPANAVDIDSEDDDDTAPQASAVDAVPARFVEPGAPLTDGPSDD